ncbi:MAG: plasmid stabilization protein [Yersiniaceae bacterium]|uniref:Plasmid stabilization protein n=1 Tax=Chimaeribacter coloradensis TaxID=2060068 RepID=A0A2N5E6Q6_9GAMM|nr:plasmid stabilization protein [Chimaeribacter coloradensis]MDU6410187.1 plasmid stabilization protein [Yersiniaceae bacterium]PLR36999.1 plasmid stabilization protein [Chimaeribacter coloradensis]
MATLTIRNLDDEIKDRLRLAAARNGHSMEEEVRAILREAMLGSTPNYGLAGRIRQRFAALSDSELALPARDDPTRQAEIE